MALGPLWIAVCVLAVRPRNDVSADITPVCDFPSFLWSNSLDGSRKYWTGKKDFIAESSNWRVMQDIHVSPKEIEVKELPNAKCTWARNGGAVECSNSPSSYKMNCLAVERHSKYRVFITHAGKTTFSCIKFIKRNDNVVQIYKAEESDVNEDILCHDNYLRRDAWPWIYKDLYPWKFCPSFGGFDFRATDNNGSQVCGDDWLPSRIESECVPGEGLVFYFPQPHCGPFQHARSEFRMQCWGHWTEGKYQYLLFSETGQLPRYSLRFHKSAEKYDELSADLFLSAIVPDNTTTTHTSHWKLKLLRSDPGVCYDESERCREAATNDKCATAAQFKHANLCRHSCGLCELAPSERSECNFNPHLEGDWMLFSEGSNQQISVSGGQVVFSEYGKYNCKGMHWNQVFYKVMSVYTNGCRPRYTCLMMQKESGDTATVQFSRSSLEDKSFEMCQFKDDIVPLGSYIHSEVPKHLLPLKSMMFTTCNLDGRALVKTSFMDGVQCDGSVADISEFTCQTKTSFIVASQQSCPHKQHFEYDCIASADLSNGRKLLVTEHTERGKDIHICWVKDISLTQYPVFTRVTCDTAVSYENFTGSNSIHFVKEGISTISLTADTEKTCSIQEDGPVDGEVNKNYDTVPPASSKGNSNNIQVSQIAIHPPHGDIADSGTGSSRVTPSLRRSDTKYSAKDKLPTSYSKAQEREDYNMSQRLCTNAYHILLVMLLILQFCLL